MRACTVVLFILLAWAPPCFGQERKEGSILVLDAAINSDRVNVREYPSTTAKVLTKLDTGHKLVVRGISEGSETIEGKIGHWLAVSVEKPGISLPIYGYVYSAYVKGGSELRPRTLAASKFVPGQGSLSPRLTITATKGGSVYVHEVPLLKDEAQDFYTFCFNTGGSAYYDEPVGTYAWRPETNEVFFVSYYSEPLGLGVYVSADLRYAFVRSHKNYTSKGIGEFNRLYIQVFRIPDGKAVFQGYVADQLRIDAHSFEFIYYYNAGEFDCDAETQRYAEAYWREANTPPWKTDDRITFVRVHFRLDLDTMERSFGFCDQVGYELAL
jgi:hypothetical protein